METKQPWVRIFRIQELDETYKAQKIKTLQGSGSFGNLQGSQGAIIPLCWLHEKEWLWIIDTLTSY